MTIRRAFAIRDLLSLCATLAVAAALVLAGLGKSRRDAMAAADLANLRWIAGVTASYAADNDDRLWGLNWQAPALPHSTPGLPRVAASGQQAIATQAIELLHRRGRPDIKLPGNWLALPMYSQLPLADYLDRDVPLLEFISTADANRLRWARDPAAFDRGEFLPLQPEPTDVNKRWPYSASYQLSFALGSEPISGADATMQGGLHFQYATQPETGFRGALVSSVAFPSQKVHLYDAEDRYAARPWFYSYTQIETEPPAADPKVTILLADGGAALRYTRDSNLGWIPTRPTAEVWTRFQYAPRPWEAGADVSGGHRADGHFRWTRRTRLRRARDRHRTALSAGPGAHERP
ncbi:MAG: hypothetical protein ACF8R7_02455 [Phycisphaerales bacterium JB039]